MSSLAIITGNSNSGKYCIEELFTKYKSLDLKIKAGFRSAEKAQPFAEKYPNLKIVTGVDANNSDSMVTLFQGCQSALIVTPADMSQSFSNDALLTCNMINTAVEHGVNYIVLVGSISTNNMERTGMIGSRFKPSEELLEKLEKEKKIKWTVLRGGCFMENFLSSVQKIKAQGVYTAPLINCPIVSTKDIGKSAAACLASKDINEHHGKYYQMNGPELLTSEDIANHIGKALGIQVKYKEIPKETLKSVMPPAVAEFFEYMIEKGKDATPFTDHITKLTDQNETFEQFLKENLSS